MYIKTGLIFGFKESSVDFLESRVSISVRQRPITDDALSQSLTPPKGHLDVMGIFFKSVVHRNPGEG